MQVTTVKLHKSTKAALDQLKGGRESYDELIAKLIAQNKRKDLRTELIRGYQNMGKADLKLLQDWEAASPPWPDD